VAVVLAVRVLVALVPDTDFAQSNPQHLETNPEALVVAPAVDSTKL
jgi:hypothetical protein